ncbi:MAG: heavy-metal-associated domain-containing protein [Mangrovibacterium sp.]
MKKNVLVALICLFAFSGAAQEAGKTKEKAKVTFTVPMDGTCCVEDINKTMAFEKGVKGLDCNLEGKTVTITYRTDQTTVEKLKNGLEAMGYQGVAVVAGEDLQTQPATKKTKD